MTLFLKPVRNKSILHRWNCRARALAGTALMPASMAALAGLNFSGAARAEDLPTGGSVVAGTAAIGTATHITTIDQSSDRAIINWAGFSVGPGNSIVFNQPDADSATLNRVTGDVTSTIAGTITANGSVYLVNPNGIAITSTGTVKTGGSFVASTLDITDDDFIAGRLNFTGKGASARVSNAGRILAGQGAFVALLGGAVGNSGTISVPLGKLAMGSGEQIALDLNGGNFLQVAVPTRLVTGSNALIDNDGTIVVTGGAVQLKAAVLKDAVRNVVNMSGSISADSATGDGGTILLIGGADTGAMAGTVTVSGVLSAQATGAVGNGGFIETSGATIDLKGATISTRAAQGSTGRWLIDPVDFTIAASGGDMTGAALSSALAANNVTIRSSGGTRGSTGNIHVNDAVSWNSNTLTLDAYRDINVNAVMRATGTAGFAGIVGDTAQNGTGSANGALNFGLSDNGFLGRLDLAATGSFRLNNVSHMILTRLGSAGSTTGTDLQGINGNLSGSYVLGADIDASATANWNGGAGFISLGMTSAGLILNGGLGFTGAFNGLGHTISNLKINQANGGYAGLFSSITGASISNVGLVNLSVDNSNPTTNCIGGLVGCNRSGTVSNSYTTGNVSGYSNTGGLVGSNGGSITGSFSTARVAGSFYVGGLIGNSNGTVNASHATGDVQGQTFAGGLIGYSGGATVSDSYAGGNVSGDASVGGLIGWFSGTVSDSYATGYVTANQQVGGLIGNAAGGVISGSYARGALVNTGSDAGGLIGVNYATLRDSYASGSVVGSGDKIGGLIGTNYGAVSGSRATGSTAGNNSVGGLIGYNDSGTVSGSNASGNILGTDYVGGLVGTNDFGSVTTSYATGIVTGTNYVGGLAGSNYYGVISETYATGSVTGSLEVGGLAGSNYAGTLSRSYATGSVSGSNIAGGLAGSNSGTVSNSYASGQVSGTGYVGGLVAFNNINGTISDSYWDSYSSTQSSGVGLISGGTITNLNAVTSDLAQSGASNYALKASAYANLSSAGWVFMGGVRPMGAWEAATAQNGVYYITNSHQLQLINASVSSLSANYVLANDLDMSATGQAIRCAFCSVGDYSGMWGGSGFASLGTDGAGSRLNSDSGFTGTFDGQGHVISNLSIKQGRGSYSGLFGFTKNAAISTLGLTGLSVTNAGSGQFVGGLIGYSAGITAVRDSYVEGDVSGGESVGGLIGALGNGTVSNSHANGSVTSSTVYYVGGLVGENIAGNISTSHATGNVLGRSAVGGLVGFNNVDGIIIDSYATSNVTGSDSYIGGLIGTNYGSVAQSRATGSVGGNGTGSSNVGGLIGYNLGAVSDSYASGSISSTGSYVGGLIGYNTSTIIRSHATGSVQGNSGHVGGLIGMNNQGSISESYATGKIDSYGKYVGGLVGTSKDGAISKSYATGKTFGNGGYVGGLVGQSSDTSIDESYATGGVGGSAYVGGLVGANTNGSINKSYAVGLTQAFNNGGYTGGLVAQNDGGVMSNSYWDSFSTSQSSGVGDNNGTVTNLNAVTSDPAQSAAANYAYKASAWSNFKTSSGASDVDAVGGQALSWRSYDGYSYPLLKAFLTTAYVRTSSTSGAVSTVYDGTNQSGAVAGLGYGATLANGGAADGGLISGTAISSCTGGDGSCINVGNYSVGVGGLYSTQQGYDLVYDRAGMVALTITVRPITLTYTANSASGIYGDAIGILSGGYAITSGTLVTGDALAGTVNWTPGASRASGVGSYAIVGGGLTAGSNYDVTSSQAAGNATAYRITARPITITYMANRATSLYGDAPATLSGSHAVSGGNLVNGDTLAGSARWSTNASSSTDVGSYGVTGSGLAAGGNYTVTSVQAASNAVAYSITARPITITYTANGASSVYGDAIAALSGRHAITSGNLVNGDVLAGSVTWSANASSRSDAGSHAVIGGGLSASANYAVTSAQAASNATAYIVTARSLAITYTANAATSMYGDALGQLSGSYAISSGSLVNGDTLTGTVNWSARASSTSGVGSYAITGGGITAGSNYDMTSLQTLSNAAAYSITARPITITYTANRTGSFPGYGLAQLSGDHAITSGSLVNGDSLAGSISWATSATGTSGVGTYAITGGGLSANGNYSVTSLQANGNATAYTIVTPPADPSIRSVTGLIENGYILVPLPGVGSYRSTFGEYRAGCDVSGISKKLRDQGPVRLQINDNGCGG